jgi:hypothetical protein
VKAGLNLCTRKFGVFWWSVIIRQINFNGIQKHSFLHIFSSKLMLILIGATFENTTGFMLKFLLINQWSILQNYKFGISYFRFIESKFIVGIKPTFNPFKTIYSEKQLYPYIYIHIYDNLLMLKITQRPHRDLNLYVSMGDLRQWLRNYHVGSSAMVRRIALLLSSGWSSKDKMLASSLLCSLMMG